MNQTNKPLRWGILGTAEIARKNWKAIRNTGNSVVTAVASRDADRSSRFIQGCQREVPFESPPRALGNYKELVEAPDVDAIYMPLPTALRQEWVIRAAEAGKHVVCEKPCATSVANLREMLQACSRNGVQFMDGVMFMHSRRLERMREVLADGVNVGEVRRMASAFSFCGQDDFHAGNIRMHSQLEPHGCLGDLGWYCIRFALWLMNGRLPQSVTGRTLAAGSRPDSPVPVPTEFSGELFFEGGVSAAFYCSFQTHDQQWVNVGGTKGYLYVPDFVLPFFGSEVTFDAYQPDYQVAGCEFNMVSRARRVSVAEYSNSHPSAQETNLFRNFAKQVLSGTLNPAWPEIALQTQQVMNACYDSACTGGRLVELH